VKSKSLLLLVAALCCHFTAVHPALATITFEPALSSGIIRLDREIVLISSVTIDARGFPGSLTASRECRGISASSPQTP